MQRREDLQHVPQLLATLAQVVQRLRGRGSVDGRTRPEHAPVCAADAPGGEPASRGPPGSRTGDLLQVMRPLADELSELSRTQPSHQPSLRNGALPGEVVVE